ncbi:MAG: hypothetical protein LBK73_09675, partial [Treponema sp.]|nr:hypothetical protein [Treponema sp.]
GKKRYACNNFEYSHKTFYAKRRYNGCKPDVKKAIIKWAADGAGIRATSAGIRRKRRYRYFNNFRTLSMVRGGGAKT